MFSVDVFLVTTSVISKKDKLFLIVKPYQNYSVFSNPCALVTVNRGTLIGTETIHHLWGRVLEKFQETRTDTDDGHIKGQLSVVL
jgi:hypothetical protein